MLQIRFNNPQLIKISMVYLYIKPGVKKNKKKDTTAMTAALNEPCIGEGDSSGVGNGLFFFASGWDSSLIYRVSPK